MEVCLIDFDLTVFQTENATDGEGEREGEGEGDGEGSFVAYRAPECKSIKKMTALGPKADVYSFGILVLELLTGRTPLSSFVHGPSSSTDHLHRWVRSVREQEMEGDVVAEDSSNDKLAVLLNVAVSCVALSPAERSTMAEILGMLEDAKESQIYPEHEHIYGYPGGDNSSERSWSEPE